MQVETVVGQLHVFYSYSHKDAEYRDELAKHLKATFPHDVVEWYDRKIEAGVNWEKAIDENLEAAHIILLLISADFMASPYCRSKEMARAMERHNANEAHVIPILLRPILLNANMFRKLQVLPVDSLAVENWPNPQNAYVNIAEGVQRVIHTVQKKQYTCKAQADLASECYQDALWSYDQAIHVDPSDPYFHNSKGDVFYKLERYEDALACYDQAIRLDSQNVCFLANRANVFTKLKRYEDAIREYNEVRQRPSTNLELSKDILNGLLNNYLSLKSFEEAITIYNNLIHYDNQNANLYAGKADSLIELGKYDRAIQAYALAIQLDRKNTQFYINIGKLFLRVQDYERALKAYEEALSFDVENMRLQAKLHYHRGTILSILDRYEEALTAFDNAISIDTDNPYIYNEKGDTLCKMQRLQDALDCYEAAIGLDEGYRVAYENKGRVLKQISEQAYEKARELKPFRENK